MVLGFDVIRSKLGIKSDMNGNIQRSKVIPHGDVEYRILKNPRTGRYTVFKVNKTIRGFGRYNLLSAGFHEKEEARRWLTQHVHKP